MILLRKWTVGGTNGGSIFGRVTEVYPAA